MAVILQYGAGLRYEIGSNGGVSPAFAGLKDWKQGICRTEATGSRGHAYVMDNRHPISQVTRKCQASMEYI